MTSLVALGLSQIQRGTWWHEPSEPWKSNTAARKRSEENRKCLMNVIRMAGGPVPMKQVAEAAGLSLFSVRNLIKPAIEAGTVIRREIGGVIHLELAKCQ